MSKLNQLKNQDKDRQKVLDWLAHIGEKNQCCIDEVIEECKVNSEARAYYIGRYNHDVLGLPLLHLVENAA